MNHSKRLSVLILMLMTALVFETAQRINLVSAAKQMATVKESTNVADTATISVSEKDPRSVIRMPFLSHTFLAPDVYVPMTANYFGARLLSAPSASTEQAVYLPESDTLFPTSFCLDVEYLPQNPELPTGCEAVALTTVLNYLGYPVTKFEIVDDYLPQGTPGEVDPTNVFPGSPYTQGGFGCFAPAIVQTANAYFDANQFTEDEAVDVSGLSVPTLCVDYLYKYKRPVVFWGSIGMVHIWNDFEWTIDGEQVPWRFNEHCLALIGWTEYSYVFSDPQCGIVEYDKKLVEEVYKENMENAVFIMPSPSYLRTCADRPETSSLE